jgi:hypothetical protein
MLGEMKELSSWPWEMLLVGRQEEAELRRQPTDLFSLSAIHSADLPQQLGANGG